MQGKKSFFGRGICGIIIFGASFASHASSTSTIQRFPIQRYSCELGLTIYRQCCGILAIDCRPPPSSLRSPAAAPARRSRRHHRSPRPPELHRRPDPESANNRCPARIGRGRTAVKWRCGSFTTDALSTHAHQGPLLLQ